MEAASVRNCPRGTSESGRDGDSVIVVFLPPAATSVELGCGDCEYALGASKRRQNDMRSRKATARRRAKTDAI